MLQNGYESLLWERLTQLGVFTRSYYSCMIQLCLILSPLLEIVRIAILFTYIISMPHSSYTYLQSGEYNATLYDIKVR